MAPGRVTDVPSCVLINIIALIKCVRTRNAISQVCRSWYDCERQTREELVVRGNYTDILCLPLGFQFVESLDLSQCSPWGNSFLLASEDFSYIQRVLRQRFPRVRKLKVYVRSAIDVAAVAAVWPYLEEVSLVRWHNKAIKPEQNLELGIELIPLLSGCPNLRGLDLSKFYCWTEDIPSALQAVSATARKLTVLDLLKLSPEGLKNSDILVLTQCCPALEELLCICEFDPRLADSVKDETLAAIGTNCPKLRVLHLVDASQSISLEAGEDENGAADLRITPIGLMSMFEKLPDLEDFALLLSQSLQSGAAVLDGLTASCRKLKKLQAGNLLHVFRGAQFQAGLGSANYGALEKLSMKGCPTLTDDNLRDIGSCCTRLESLSFSCCSEITYSGLGSLANSLKSTLVSVALFECVQIPTAAACAALEPLKQSLQTLQLDCDWRILEGVGAAIGDGGGPGKPSSACAPNNLSQGLRMADHCKCWQHLRKLTLRAALGTLLSKLVECGLASCPELESVQIQVEGDCRLVQRPGAPAFGLAYLASLPKLRSLCMDLSGVRGFSITCAPGFTDVSLWERFYLHGIQVLKCQTLEYWPPSDTDLNRRSLSMAAVALLSACGSVRKLYLHGAVNEHLMQMLLRCKELRDVHRWDDYYPAPADEIATEVQVAASRRFEAALANRGFPD